jgi:hypothetical protein
MAEDLPRTKLSEYLEDHVRNKVNEYIEKCSKEKAEADVSFIHVIPRAMLPPFLLTPFPLLSITANIL